MDKHSLCCLLRCAILVVMAFVAGCHTNSKSLVTSQERSYKTRFSDRETMSVCYFPDRLPKAVVRVGIFN